MSATQDAIEKTGDAADAEAHAGDGACANCGTRLVGSYCHACGQHGHLHRNITALLHDIAHGVFHFEGKIWRTLPLLIARPGALTRRYVHGQRARFVAPLAFFLFSVFLLFSASSWLSITDLTGAAQGYAQMSQTLKGRAATEHQHLQALQARRAKALALDPHADVKALDQDIDQSRDNVEALDNFSGKVLPQIRLDGHSLDIGTLGQKPSATATGLGRQLEIVRENPVLFLYKLKIASYKYSWALIPISLPFIWILFCFRRDVGLYDHAIFAIYSLTS